MMCVYILEVKKNNKNINKINLGLLQGPEFDQK